MSAWRTGFLCTCLALIAGSAAAQVSPIEAAHLVAGDRTEVETLPTLWNRSPVVFVHYLETVSGSAHRMLFVVHRGARGRLQQTRVTAIEEEGGPPEIAAIGFANADRDRALELVVIATWPQKHYDYEGSFYEVRLFDDLKPGQAELRPLNALTAHFGLACDCDWRDGTHKRYRFKTINAVKSELRRLGFKP